MVFRPAVLPGSLVMILILTGVPQRYKESGAKGSPQSSTAASRTLLWHVSGSGCRGLRPSTGRGNPGKQPSPCSYLPTKRTLCPVVSAPVRLSDPRLRCHDDRESSETPRPLPHIGARQPK